MEPPSRAREYRHGLWAFLLYEAAALALFGARLLPHLTTSFAGAGGDVKFDLWALEWWPYAVAHGVNPFLPHVIVPAGLNLAWSTSIPGPSLMMSPVTATAGPVATFNLMSLLAAPLSAWSAYLLCRCLTKRFWPSIVGGFFFGFASFELGHTRTGHLNLTLVFAIPLLAYLVIRRLHDDMGSRSFVLAATGLLVLQFLAYTEFFLTAAMVTALLLAAGALLTPRGRRGPIASTAKQLGLAYLIASAVVSPYLAYILSRIPSRSFVIGTNGSADLLSPLVPTKGWIANHLSVSLVSRMARVPLEGPSRPYLGLPLFAVAAWVCARTIRSRIGKLLSILMLVTLVATWGRVLYVAGHRVSSLPWRTLWNLPVLRDVVPTRFGMYVVLGAAVAVALWLATDLRRGWIRFGAVVLAAAVLLASRPSAPELITPASFLSERVASRATHPGELVVMLPYDNNLPLALQAESRMQFRLLSPFVTLLSGFIAGTDQAKRLTNSQALQLERLRRPSLPPRDWRAMELFFGSQGVNAILVYAPIGRSWHRFLDSLHVRVDRVGGATIYTLSSRRSAGT
jgi:hypothetical protein